MGDYEQLVEAQLVSYVNVWSLEEVHGDWTAFKKLKPGRVIFGDIRGNVK